VDLSLDVQKEQPYVKPKAKYKPFSGQGQRLGSPTPGPSTSIAPAASSSVAPSAPAPLSTSSGAAAPPAQATIDDARPTITLQIRLGDGTRLQSRFNTTHTVGDVYEFVDRASPASAGREYALMTTFPSKELDNRGAVLGDLAEFKRGGVVVQKWK
jgi:UBX domain-containing protein 1